MILHGIECGVLQVMKNMYSEVNFCVIVEDQCCDLFSCHLQGVRQGEHLSPLLFDLFFECCMDGWTTLAWEGDNVSMNNSKIDVLLRVFLLLCC